METNLKKKYSKSLTCPHCGKFILIEAGDKILKAAVSAEKEPYVKVEKDLQTSLDGDHKRELAKKKKGTAKRSCKDCVFTYIRGPLQRETCNSCINYSNWEKII